VKNELSLKQLGATHVLSRDLSTPEVIAEIKKITPKPIEYAYDAVVYDSTQQLAVDIVSLSPKGGHVALATPYATITSANENVKIAKIFGGATPYNDELFKTLYHDKLYEWVEKGFIIVSRYSIGKLQSILVLNTNKWLAQQS